MALFDPEFSSLSSDELCELDRICSDFERQRLSGEDCSIESYVDKAIPDIGSRLAQELIRIDLEISREWDEPIDGEHYAARFPAHANFIREVLLETFCRTRNVEDRLQSPSTPAAMNESLDTLPDAIADDVLSEEADAITATDPNNMARSRFQIIRNLATGGIGTIHVGIDRDLDREVAIKVLKRKFALDPNIMARFRTEATITSHLEHPNIVPVYAVGVRSDGLPFYAMRLVRGRSLQQAINGLHASHSGLEFRVDDFRRIPACRDLLMRFITACRAAAFAHSRGIVHRDIKPGNIMVDDFGETLLVDWGLAIPTRPRSDRKIIEPQTQLMVGTPGYMSPEQATGGAEAVDSRSDIYSLGATLVTLLTRQIPHSHLNTGINTTVAVHEGKRITRFEHSKWFHSRHLPLDLQSIIDQALQENPQLRYESAAQLADDLECWLADEPVSVRREPWTTKMRRWMKVHPAISGAVFAGAACITLALTIGTLILATQNETLRQANKREQIAVEAADAHAARAEMNAAEALKQRERVLSVLNRFLMDVEQGLTNVPGGANVQRKILVTVLNELEVISKEFGNEADADMSNAAALLELASLFARFGHSDIRLTSRTEELGKGTPLEVAERLADEAWEVAQRIDSENLVPLLALRAHIREKQANIFQQTGRLELSLTRLNEALELRRAIEAKEPESVDLARSHIGTMDHIGLHYWQRKQLDQAAEILVEAHRRALDLSLRAPEDLSVLRLLAVSCSRRGDLANANGDLDEAERWFDEDLQLTKKIYETDSDNALAARDLAVSLDRLGKTRESRGKLEEATEAYEEARQLRTELRDADPSDLQTNRELFVSNFKLGAINMVLKQFEDAKRYYRQADELAQQMVAADQSNTTARRYQSLCAEAMCDILLSESKPEEALPFALVSLKITEELAEISPSDGNIQKDVLVLQTKIAKVHRLRGDLDACLQQLEAALEFAEISLKASNHSLESMQNYSSVLLRLGDACLAARKPALAVDYIERMLDNEASMPTEKRQDADARRQLVNAHSRLGQAQIELGNLEDAEISLVTARDLAKKMIDEQMRIEQMQADLQQIEQLLTACREGMQDDK